jgi:hypothetical protein
MMVSLHLTFISHFALGELGAEGRKACLESHKLSNRLSRHVSRLSGGLWLSNKILPEILLISSAASPIRERPSQRLRFGGTPCAKHDESNR